MDLKDETAREYVDILKQKSQRLKLLIEDLFEAAKLSSHSMELTQDPADIVELLKQSIGEMSEKFEDMGLDIKFSSNTDRYIMMLDGQRMWRVFENLLNNILKYAPKGTRVYITLNNTGDNIEITMKNISAFELDFMGNDLFERFKRGDSARTTEGSGLGLSITKDIIELHGGKMDIVIDGDLFKVIILLKAQGV
jgi:signal transduction histidine kinase